MAQGAGRAVRAGAARSLAPPRCAGPAGAAALRARPTLAPAQRRHRRSERRHRRPRRDVDRPRRHRRRSSTSRTSAAWPTCSSRGCSAAASSRRCRSTPGCAGAVVAAGDRRRPGRAAAGGVHQRRDAVRGPGAQRRRSARRRPCRCSPARATRRSSMSTFGKAYLAFTAIGRRRRRRARRLLLPGPVGAGVDARSTPTRPTTPAPARGRPRRGRVRRRDRDRRLGRERPHLHAAGCSAPRPASSTSRPTRRRSTAGSEVSAAIRSISSGGDSTYASVAFQESCQRRATPVARADEPPARLRSTTGSRRPTACHHRRARGRRPAADRRSPSTARAWSPPNTTRPTSCSPPRWATTTARPTVESTRLPNSVRPTPSRRPPASISTLIAWQQTRASRARPRSALRYAPDGVGPRPRGGRLLARRSAPTNADEGLVAGGRRVRRRGGRLGAGHRRRAPGSSPASCTRPPAASCPRSRFRYATSANPALSWSPASAELWGSPQLRGQVRRRADRPDHRRRDPHRAPVANGRHTWQVTAVNQAGLTHHRAAGHGVRRHGRAARHASSSAGRASSRPAQRLRVALQRSTAAGLPRVSRLGRGRPCPSMG